VAKHKWFEADMPGIYDVLDQNYGHAGEKYIKYLVQLEESDTKARLREMTEHFSKAVGFEGKERFWYALVACVLYSLWLADGSGAIKFANVNATYQRLWKWCIEQVTHQRTAVADNKFSAVEALSMFLNAHLADRLVVTEMGKGMVAVIKPPAAHGKLLVEYNQSTGVISIDQNAIRNWLSKAQLSTHQIRADLTKGGILIDHGARDFKVTMGRGTQFKGGQTRVWQVNAKHTALDGIDKLLERDPEVT
jgi:hypothetical protein